MSNEKTQLPPELVEKMKLIISDSRYEPVDIQKDAEKCAQIAVDYVAEKCVDYVKQNSELHFENRILKQQRDELIDNIKELNSSIDAWWNGERSDSQAKKINAVQRKSFELLKKHES